MIKRFAILLAGLIPVLSSFFVSPAQAAVEDRGIKIGSGKLHPYYQLEPHFATNPGRKESASGLSDLELLNRLGLQLDVPTDKIKLDMNLSGEYDWYLGLMDKITQNYSDWGLDFDMGLQIAHKRKLSIKINEQFSRGANAYNPAITSGLSLINNTTGLDFIYKPGGGALQFILSYNCLLYWYMSDSINVDALQNMRHKVAFQTSWRFFPKTSLNFTISTSPTVYLEDSGSYANINTVPLAATVGLVGLITNRLSIIANVGYGGNFVLSDSAEEEATDDNNTLHTVVGRLELRYNMPDDSAFSIGYNRDVGPMALYRFYTKNDWYINYNHLLLNKRLAIATKVSYAYYIYGESLVANSYTSERRKDGVLSGEASIGYNCKRIFSISLVDRVEFRHSDYITFIGTGVGYINNNLFIRMDIRY